MTARVLVVDDEKTFRAVAEAALVAEGYEVQSAASASEGVALARTRRPEVVILDRNLPDGDGLAVLHQLLAGVEGEVPLVVMATAYGDLENAVQAIKSGAFDYLTKPLQLPDLMVTVRKAVDAFRLRRRARGLYVADRRRFEQAVCMGASEAMRRAVALCEAVATSPDTTVLVEGESGSGKEVLARLVHLRTPVRCGAAFVELTCAAIPAEQLEDELFGHERGGHGGAKRERAGLIEEADGGTVFLDEIGDMPLSTQVKLLKVLESRTFRRLGGDRDLHANVRFIAATHRDLAAAVAEGSFRIDLFHRLDVFRMRATPLRERREDVLPLARFFLEAFSRRAGKSIAGLLPETERKLLAYAFPGNVRELRNLVERAVILETGPSLSPFSVLLRGEDADGADGVVREVADRAGSPPSFDQVERAYLVRLVERAKGNLSQVARWSGLSYATIQRKMTEYGIGRPRRD